MSDFTDKASSLARNALKTQPESQTATSSSSSSSSSDQQFDHESSTTTVNDQNKNETNLVMSPSSPSSTTTTDDNNDNSHSNKEYTVAIVNPYQNININNWFKKINDQFRSSKKYYIEYEQQKSYSSKWKNRLVEPTVNVYRKIDDDTKEEFPFLCFSEEYQHQHPSNYIKISMKIVTKDHEQFIALLPIKFDASLMKSSSQTTSHYGIISISTDYILSSSTSLSLSDLQLIHIDDIDFEMKQQEKSLLSSPIKLDNIGEVIMMFINTISSHAKPKQNISSLYNRHQLIKEEKSSSSSSTTTATTTRSTDKDDKKNQVKKQSITSSKPRQQLLVKKNNKRYDHDSYAQQVKKRKSSSPEPFTSSQASSVPLATHVSSIPFDFLHQYELLLEENKRLKIEHSQIQELQSKYFQLQQDNIRLEVAKQASSEIGKKEGIIDEMRSEIKELRKQIEAEQSRNRHHNNHRQQHQHLQHYHGPIIKKQHQYDYYDDNSDDDDDNDHDDDVDNNNDYDKNEDDQQLQRYVLSKRRKLTKHDDDDND